MKQWMILGVSVLLLTSCGSRKKTTEKNIDRERTVTVGNDVGKKDALIYPSEISASAEVKMQLADEIIRTASSFLGTRYRYGGTTKSGMDCSGLVYTSFINNGISLERSSYLIAEQGEKIKLKEARKGDLLFFITGKKSKRINHVGIVIENRNGEIRFIHASTSRGVIISSLDEGYWKYAFKEVKRIL
ncbi:C40 family peptidase [Zhouia sp. PK063]|uniref:C40 family peptidase n=1 Tax=Zhouia sp. PK063 TaxID=3373602 RepID=UPI0037A85682